MKHITTPRPSWRDNPHRLAWFRLCRATIGDFVELIDNSGIYASQRYAGQWRKFDLFIPNHNRQTFYSRDALMWALVEHLKQQQSSDEQATA